MPTGLAEGCDFGSSGLKVVGQKWRARYRGPRFNQSDGISNWITALARKLLGAALCRSSSVTSEAVPAAVHCATATDGVHAMLAKPGRLDRLSLGSM
jgi:hypothetical protein